MSDAQSVKEDKKESKEEPKNDEPVIEFDKSKKFPEEIKEEVRKALLPMLSKPSPTTISKNLVSMLNKKFGNGWNVVTGGHFSGSFTYIEGFYTECKVKDLVISIFKIYIPQK
ncbi:hypothetical protein NGRA_0874 [Nosema granulosis]|uniref:Dynein light chain n=1 Tax=Nosema granulosis TaxID=83296 RepID=A0A9P6H0K3_9MICR|nr:hypothetical protein NGRA_0874 [Nosema granulosis]